MSSTRAAFSTKSGLRGKIQERVCHGLMASSCDHRHIAEADASVTLH
jgi:hypothetical protein